ncbi:hypothetical protein D3C78_1567530 [compost metagenome]
MLVCEHLPELFRWLPGGDRYDPQLDKGHLQCIIDRANKVVKMATECDFDIDFARYWNGRLHCLTGYRYLEIVTDFLNFTYYIRAMNKWMTVHYPDVEPIQLPNPSVDLHSLCFGLRQRLISL